MAEIKLVTGAPGAGKSLYALTCGLAFVAEGRPVYVQGFNGIDYEATGFKELPFDFADYDPSQKDDKGRQLVKWQTLEPGAVIILDECYDYIPQRGAGKPVPYHVDALARHRHYNIDLIFITQKHGQIDSFVQGLIKTHIHVRNKFGFNAAVLKTWDEFQANTKARALVAPTWRYPKKNFKLYKSATAHSVKKKLPWFFYAVPVLLAVIIALGWYVKHSFGAKGAAVTDASAAGAAAPRNAGSSSSDRDPDEDLRRSNYAKWITPRVPGQPWTAPAFDKLQVMAEPELYCLAGENGYCGCVTEQGTKYDVKPSVCRAIARDGNYNPFKRAGNPRSDDRRREEPARERSASVAASGPAIGGGRGLQRGESIPQSYEPPEYQTPAAAEAFH